MTYREADRKCHELNATLVTIDSEDQNLFITSLIYGLNTGVKGLYIGLRREIVNDSFIDDFQWTDGLALTYTNWAPGEPTPWYEPCVELYSVDINAGKWNDISCNSRRYALCQQLVGNGSYEYMLQFDLCEHLDYVRYKNNCYKAYEWPTIDWVSADEKCKSDHRNGSLLFIEDSYEYSFIKYWTKYQLKSIEFWIGLNANNNSLNVTLVLKLNNY